MITNFFIPELNNHDVQELWFQQDGATCHTARATIDLLKDTFGDRLISRFGPVNWPPRSCDLTPLYFLWSYVKSLVYADKPQTLDHLEDNIRRVIVDIWPQMLEKVIENWTSRLDYIRASRGSHMPEIIFKIDAREFKSFRLNSEPLLTRRADWRCSVRDVVGFNLKLRRNMSRIWSIEPEFGPLTSDVLRPGPTGPRASLHSRLCQSDHDSDIFGQILIPFIFSEKHDEAHFWLNGYVNKQNCRIWSEANPQVYVETPLHPEKLTVWCALWAGGILLQKR
ncbi:DUF4817 domain-containing protein [Trichonephila clavipes]|nr:DUF4817 domain-containing protein [Trichonephila clavipes]